MTTRAYVDGAVTHAYLSRKLDDGLVCTDIVPKGHSGGDVAYFRTGTEEEIADCRRRLASALTPAPEAHDAR